MKKINRYKKTPSFLQSYISHFYGEIDKLFYGFKDRETKMQNGGAG